MVQVGISCTENAFGHCFSSKITHPQSAIKGEKCSQFSEFTKHIDDEQTKHKSMKGCIMNLSPAKPAQVEENTITGGACRHTKRLWIRNIFH